MSNSVIYSHPLETNDEDDFNNNNDRNVVKIVKTENKPRIPPRNKVKQTSVVNESSVNDEPIHKNYCQNQINDVLKNVNIDPLNIQPQMIRWLYKEDSTSSKWSIFNGLDSLSLECEYLLSKQNSINVKSKKTVQVLNRLFEVDILERKYAPIYWEGSSFPVMRGTWFYDQTWEPLDEDICERLELEHVHKFKDFILNKINSNNINNNENNESSATVNNELLNNDGLSNEPQTSVLNSNKSQSKQLNDPIYTITNKDQICYWYTPDDIYISNNNKILNKVFSFGNKRIGVRINRGYKTSADTDDNSGDITHLVFVVHGIAQKLYEKSIIKNRDDLRKGFESVKAKFYADNKKSLRCEFIPVDWRSSLTLDDGIVETITPQTIKSIRNKLNSSALDIMYYTSPLFRLEIMNGLSSELNRLYNLFCEKNPYFKARNCKVSVVCHSLGSVIFYDILTHNNSLLLLSNTYGEDINQEKKVFNHFSKNNSELLDEYLNAKKRVQEIEEKLLENNQNIHKLEFQPENLFNLGSPLAVFLALRGVRPGGSGKQDHILPKKVCKHLFNIFHPCDAIAYRLEPLVLKHYSSIMPIEIHKASDPFLKHVPYKQMPHKVLSKTIDFELSAALKDSSASTSSISSISFNFLKNKKINDQTITINDQPQENNDLQMLTNRIQNIFSSNPVNNNSSNAINKSDNIHDAVDLERRLDYQLPSSSNFELISALTSHTAYWQSADIALFLVTQLISSDEDK